MKPHSLKDFNPDSSGQVAWEDGERVFSRGWRLDDDGKRSAVLLVAPAADHPSRSSLDRLIHEYELKDQLDGAWALRPLALVHDTKRTTLVLDDPGGEPLDRALGSPMEAGSFLRLAIASAKAVGEVHGRDLVHKDIKPANILVNRMTGAVKLTGFGIASRLARERQSPEPPETIAGTLAYIAPEQTGRMNRSIDARSDLYSLGITLYQMLTGSLPFAASDPMEWVHCHIARKPVPPAERLSNVPAALSAIVMKLLAKTAEERYQTAIGLENDLTRCLTQWETQGRIDEFALGERDTPDRLLIPERLYGRTRAIETLLAAFDRVMRSGTPELVLVSGYSGIGKSSVVNELHKVLVPPRGLFAGGKFDQYKRDIPYATLAQAFQSLVRGLLAKSEADLAPWRDALSKALDSNGQLMVDLVPQLEFIIGKQPPVQPLEPQQARARFQLMFRRFISVFARPDHPLALFLDDLQWLDPATLDLLEDLLIRSDMQNLMLIGAYRDNEITAAHPLMRKVDDIKIADGKVVEIALEPLAREDFERLIADTFRCELDRAVPLAHLVHEKTGGNPFFANQFIHALAEEGLLTLDHAAGRWSWHLRRIQTRGYTDNVVDLMVGKLTRLPAETQEALQQFACLGNVAEITMLSIVLGTSEEQVHEALRPSVRQELVGRLSGAYRFVHDRIQEAAYSLIPEEQRVEMHLRIGRFLVANTTADKREEAVFDIVNQLNRGAPKITSQDEREQLAELNQLAGKRAKASAAYASALNYFVAGARLLPEDSWERRHELTFELELRRAECEFLTRDPVAAEQRLAALSQRAVSTLERAQVASLLVDVYYTLDQSGRAIAVSLDYLSDLGIDWSPHPTEEQARREYQRVLSQLGNRTIEELSDLPLMTDPVSLATIDVLVKVIPAAFLSDANLALLIISRAVNLSLERGNCDGSCSAYVRLGMHAGARFGDYQAGYRFGRLGYGLIERRGLKRFQARTCMHFGNVILPMAEHVRAGRELLHRAFDDANKVGDLIYAAYYGLHATTNRFFAGDSLAEAQRGAEDGLAFARNAQFGFAIDIISSQLGLIRTLRGLTAGFGSLNHDQFDETRIESRFSVNPNLALCELWYWIRKLQARFFAGDYVAGVEAASKAERLLWISASFLEENEYHFYAALAMAAVSDLVAADARRDHVGAIAVHYRHLQLRAEACPDNFENRAALVGAEIARLEGRDSDAMRLYEQAIRSARDNGFVHNQAIAYERASAFYQARGFDQFAETYLCNARLCYLRWGADAKVRELDRLHSHIAEPQSAATRTTSIDTPVERLDLETVIKVSQAVSGEIVLENLIDTLMRTAMEQAGAERALLIVPRGQEPRIEAEARTSGATVTLHLLDEAVTGRVLPESVLRYVLRTREIVILEDAVTESPFGVDSYLRQRQARSILCLPLLNQAKLVGVLYLENNLTPRVFAPARISVLKLLASQAAIALENAHLYRDAAERERQQTAASKMVRIIATSPIQSVLDTVAENAAQLCDATNAEIFRLEGNLLRLVASYGEIPVTSHAYQGVPLNRDTVTGRAACDRRTIHVHDLAAEEDEYPVGSSNAKREGHRTTLGTPLLREGIPIGIILVRRREVRPFSDQQIALIETFADQTVIASENARLFEAEKQRALALERANRDLAEREAKIRRLVDSNIIGIFIWDFDGRILEANEAFLHIVGYDHEDLVAGRLRWTDLTAPEWRDRDTRLIQELKATGTLQPFEKEYLRKDGRPVPVLIGVALVEGGDQGVAFVLDLTERKRAEERLRVQHMVAQILAEVVTIEEATPRILRTMGECLGWDVGAFWRVDLKAEVLRCVALWHQAPIEVPEFERVSQESTFGPGLGLPGRVWSSLQPEYVHDVVSDENFPRGPVAKREELHAALAFPILLGGEALGVIEFFSREIRQPDQELLDVLATIGSQIGQFIERKQAEMALRDSDEALRRSEAWLSQAQRLSHIGTWVMNGTTRRFLYWSDESYRIWGFDPLKGLPTRDDMWGRFHPDDREGVWGEVQEALREKRDLFAKFRILLPDGTVKYLESNAHHDFSPAGALLEVICTNVDVTERKRARDERERLRQLEADLAHMNRVRTMGELAASLSHEILHPIATARNNARAGMRFLEMNAPNLDEAREAFACVVRDADRAKDIIGRMRDHIKKAPPRKEHFDLNEAINEVIVMARSAIADNRVSIQTRLAEGSLAIHGDRIQLQQVLLNLILNAVEAMGSVEAGARELLVSTEQDRTGVLVAVRDTGPGIDATHLELVFEAFYTTKSGGTGMGLLICRSIIDAHGGKLWAEANEPRGAVFRFTLPAAQEDL